MTKHAGIRRQTILATTPARTHSGAIRVRPAKTSQRLDSINNKKLACVFGARRTGTNYLESLLETNFGAELCVANLNRENTRPLAHRPHLFEAVGSKHAMDDRPFQEKFGSGQLNIFIVRHPHSWTGARIRYALKYLGLGSGQITEATVGKWIAQEYVSFYSGVAERLHYIPNTVVVRYEDLLDDYASALGRLAAEIGLSERTLTNVTTRIGPAGGQGGGAFDIAPPSEAFEACIQNALNDRLPNGLMQFFYGANATLAG